MKGRPPKRPGIGQTRELTLEEVKNVKKGRVEAVQQFRDSHHRVARLFASGLRPGEVAELTGYSLTHISVLYSSPLFKELIEQKRLIEDRITKDCIQSYNDLILSNGLKAERKLADKLDSDDGIDEMSIRELLSISRDAADIVGLSKRTVQTSVSIDFASLLDRAIQRTREVLPRSGDMKLVSA